MQSNPPSGYIQAESQVPGIEVFVPAPVMEDKLPENITYVCPRCGASTHYSTAAAALKCAYCGYEQEVQAEVVGKAAVESEFTTQTVDQERRGWGEERRELECQNCGARLSLPAQALTHTCTFCGSNKVLHHAETQDRLRPGFLIPFQVDESRCRQIATQWLGSSWMTPSELEKMAGQSAFVPIYLPFWTFDSRLQASWKAEVGHTVSERYYDHSSKSWKTRHKTVWRWENGQVDQRLDDILVPGTDRISSLHLNRIGAFDLSQLAVYEPGYLAGHQAYSYDVNLDQAWQKARDIMREHSRNACRGQASSSQIRNFSMDLDFGEESWRFVLLPVYVSAYTFSGAVYQVLVNGQNGAISGQRPVDWQKVWLVILAVFAPGVLLGLAGLVTIPLAGFGMILGGVGVVLLIIAALIAIIIGVKANRMDDA